MSTEKLQNFIVIQMYKFKNGVQCKFSFVYFKKVDL